MARLADRIERLHTELHAQVTEAVATALAGTARKGRATWTSLLASWGVRPLPEEEARPPEERSDGVPSLELRHLLEAIRITAQRQLNPLKRAARLRLPRADKRTMTTKIDALQGYLDDLVAQQMRRYLKAAQRHPGVSGIFARPQCPDCGAARPSGSELCVCAFCGSGLTAKETQ